MINLEREKFKAFAKVKAFTMCENGCLNSKTENNKEST